MSVNILDEKEVISLLYTLNIIMIIHSIDESITNTLKKAHSIRKRAVVHSIRPVAKDYGYKEPKYSNLYIEHWKKIKMYMSPQFPLERLAFLNSVYHFCHRQHFFYLKNSQIKQLASKKVNPIHCDEVCHPSKLVTDLFTTYIHRRALFFRNRNVCAAGRRQFTKSYFYPKRRSEDLEAYEYSLLYGKDQEQHILDMSKTSKLHVEEQLENEKLASEKMPKLESSDTKNEISSISPFRFHHKGFKSVARSVVQSLIPKKFKSGDNQTEEEMSPEKEAVHGTTDDISLYDKS
ncbi:uncharacterized protein NPIL_319731 [Nephila pilipes]|uniref:Uncharacterized protein n=1 Tax=Nephila pilipes TaxID=299642 RepID=A0A8X6KCH9_NEPPI|nr:uncharacterized protein NPIL_319731 [Nephila pilipes]